jgi:hypothetical protein
MEKASWGYSSWIGSEERGREIRCANTCSWSVIRNEEGHRPQNGSACPLEGTGSVRNQWLYMVFLVVRFLRYSVVDGGVRPATVLLEST